MARDGRDSSTARLPERLDRAAVDAAVPIRVIPGRNVSKADIRVVRLGDRTVAVKDYRARPFLVRHSAGRFLVRRECRAMAAAAGVPGLPEFLGRIDAVALATAWLDATPLADLEGAGVPAGTFDKLEALVEALHGRGIALADLHHRDVLLGADGSVSVVDLATALVITPRSFPWRKALFARLKEHDRLNLARLRARYTGGTEAEALSGLDPAVVRRYTASRWVKSAWDRLRGKDA